MVANLRCEDGSEDWHWKRLFLVPYGSLRYFVCNFSRKFESSLSCFVFASLGVFALDYYYFSRLQLLLARLQVEIGFVSRDVFIEDIGEQLYMTSACCHVSLKRQSSQCQECLPGVPNVFNWWNDRLKVRPTNARDCVYVPTLRKSPGVLAPCTTQAICWVTIRVHPFEPHTNVILQHKQMNNAR